MTPVDVIIHAVIRACNRLQCGIDGWISAVYVRVNVAGGE